MGDATLESETVANQKEQDIQTGKIKNSKYKPELPDSIKNNANLIDEKLQNIRVCDPAIGSGAFPVGMMNEIVKARMSLNPYVSVIPSDVVADLSAKTTSVIANEVKQSRSFCHSEQSEESRTPYNFKRHAIQNCLYGVDIDSGAVEIAKLRMWLSLIVDEEDMKHIKPLPNLDYKVMQGNSLLEEFEGIKLFDEKYVTGVDFDKKKLEELKEKQSKLSRKYKELDVFGKSNPAELLAKDSELIAIDKELKQLKQPKNKPEATTFFDELSEAKKTAELLKSLHEQFRDETQKTKKDKLKEQIENLTWELIEKTLKEEGKQSDIEKVRQFRKANIKPFFLWKLHFAEVFNEKGGFDVVIANPPYVRQEDIKEYKQALQRQGYEIYNSTSDLYTYFYERSYHILSPKGYSCFISSNKWMRAKYGEKLRNFFKTNTKVVNIIDFGGHKVFETATVDTNILLFQKTKPQFEYIATYINIGNDFTGENLDEYAYKKHQSIKQNEFSDSGWTLADDKVLALKKKIEKIGIPLKDCNVKIYRGVTTGLNEAFIIDNETKERLCKEDPKSKEILKPILRGRDINKWHHEYKGYYLIYSYADIDIKKYEAIYNYLKQYKSQLEQVWEAKYGKKKWYELRGCDYYGEFEKEKIVWQLIVQESSFTYATDKLYCLDTGFIMVGKNLKYLIALLNSKPIDTFFRKYYVGNTLGRNGYKYSKVSIEQLPIPKISEIEQKPFIELVDKILAITNPPSSPFNKGGQEGNYLTNSTKQAKVKEYEHQIDQMVYELYGLTEEEIKIVEKSK